MSAIVPPYDVDGSETGVQAIKVELQDQLDYLVTVLRGFETSGALDFTAFALGGSGSVSEWTQITSLGSPTRIDATQFKFTDASAVLPALLPVGRPIKMDGSTTAYGHVQAVVAAAGETTVTVFEGNVPTGLTAASYVLLTPSAGYLPVVSKAGAPPTWASDFAGILFINTSTNRAYFGAGAWRCLNPEWQLEIASIAFDAASPPTTGYVNTDTPAVIFGPTVDSIGRFSFRVPTVDQGINTSKDLKFHVNYAMSTSVASKQVSLNIDYRVNGGASQPCEDEISVPADTTWATHDGINLKVPTGSYAAADLITGKIWRDIDGVAQNHTGDFQAMSLWVTNE